MIRYVVAGALALMTTEAALAAKATYYQLPDGAYPHDVAPAVDGAIWYSGQRKGFLGRFDPATGTNEEIPLGPRAAPHGVITGPDGAPWLTEGGQNAMAHVDPKTRMVTLFPLPKEFARANLNTAVFDKQGILWFTGQNGVHGRVDPKSGKVDAWASPKGRGSYGITVTPSGDVWFASLASDYIGKINRATGAVEVVEPPKQGVGPRRVWSDSKGLLWSSFWHSGEVGRYDPVAKTWKVWALPKSGSGCYSVYVDDKDKIWLTDFVANSVVRFDPATETFESFVSDKRGSNVRQMLGRPGEAWGGESGTDRLVVIRD